MSKAILKLYEQGVPIKQIARDMKLSIYHVTGVCTPEQHELAKLRNRDYTTRSARKQQEMERLQAMIPEDDRTHLQVLMGEPPYKRSALYQKEQNPWKPKSVAIPIEKGAGE